MQSLAFSSFFAQFQSNGLLQRAPLYEQMPLTYLILVLTAVALAVLCGRLVE